MPEFAFEPPDALPADEAELAERVRSGDESAFTTLVDLHLDAAIRLAYRFLGSRDAALDCAQAVFARIWEHRERFHPTLSVRSYILSTTHWQVLKDVRYARRRPDSRGDTRGDSERLLHEVAGANHERALIDRMTVDAILATLPERKRLVLQLRYVEELSLQEVADVMGASRPAVERMIHRTLDELRKRLPKFL
jgi:RNA polymerase sigma-70 factor (ECF subfamily)